MSDMESTWQLEGEPDDAWAGRLRYFEFGPGRTLARLAGEVGLSARTIERWSATWGWVQLAAKYDQELATARHELALAATKADAIAKSGLVESIDALDLQRMAFDRISESAVDMLGCLVEIATGKIKAPKSQLDAIKHALGMIGLQPITRIEQRTRVSGSLDHRHSQEDSLTEEQLHELLSSLDNEALRALNRSLEQSADEVSSEARAASPGLVVAAPALLQ